MISRGILCSLFFLGNPFTEPNVSIPVNQNEEFACVFESSFGSTNLLYSAEIDGVCSREQIQDTLVGKAVTLIELKTMKHHIFGKKGNGQAFHRAFQMATWWSQSYLVGIEKIILGLKKKNFVTKIEEVKLDTLIFKSQVINFSNKMYVIYQSKYIY